MSDTTTTVQPGTLLDRCATFTFTAEGDAVASVDPRDDGNWSGGQQGVGQLIGTKYGISAPVLISWMASDPDAPPVTRGMMENLPKSVAEAIFGSRYFNAMSCARMPDPVAMMTCDHGYNAGDTASVKILQRVLGFTGDDVDGWAGDHTVAAIGAADAQALALRLSPDAARKVQAHLGIDVDGLVGSRTMAAIMARNDRSFVVAAAQADAQLAAYKAMRKWSVYGNGWTSRLWSRLDAALDMAA